MTELLALLSSPLVTALIPVVPGLVGSIAAVFHKQGKVTTLELAEFLSAQWLDPESVFRKSGGAGVIGPLVKS